MYDHLGLRVCDLGASVRFYAAVLAPLGHVVGSRDGTSAGLGPKNAPVLWLYAAKDSQGGVHLAFQARSRAAVDLFYSAGLEAGGRDNGPPGVRADYGPSYYAAFLIDPDGNNVEAVHAGGGRRERAMSSDSLAFADALVASGPAFDRAEKMKLYGQFVGSWDGIVVVHRDGQRVEASCEVHFGWALAGRAVQDVWIVPSRSTRGAAEGDRMYGTTLRVYDPDSDRWEITWIDPVRRSFDRMIGRADGDDIVQEYRDAAGAVCQWCFTEIQLDSFHWISRESTDDRATWKVTAEFFLARRR